MARDLFNQIFLDANVAPPRGNDECRCPFLVLPLRRFGFGVHRNKAQRRQDAKHFSGRYLQRSQSRNTLWAKLYPTFRRRLLLNINSVLGGNTAGNLADQLDASILSSLHTTVVDASLK